MPTSRLALALSVCLLVASTAAAQYTFNEFGMVAAPVYQIKADRVGNAFICLRKQDIKHLTDAMDLVKSESDPEVRARMAATLDEHWTKLAQHEICGLIRTDAVLTQMETDEEYPELVGVKNPTPSGRLTGRLYWTRLDWLEPHR